MIRRPIGSSKDLLVMLERAPRLNIPFDEAFRTLAADVVALQEENSALRDAGALLLREMNVLRSQLGSLRK